MSIYFRSPCVTLTSKWARSWDPTLRARRLKKYRRGRSRRSSHPSPSPLPSSPCLKPKPSQTPGSNSSIRISLSSRSHFLKLRSQEESAMWWAFLRSNTIFTSFSKKKINEKKTQIITKTALVAHVFSDWLNCCSLLQKYSPAGSENTIGGGMGMLKGGRRRWGQSKTRESREELHPSEMDVSVSKKPTLAKPEDKSSLKEHQPLYGLRHSYLRWKTGALYFTDLPPFGFRPKVQEPLYSFSTLTKLPSNVKISQLDSNLPTSAARQHYLSQSRYLPGKTSGWVPLSQL